MRVIEIARKNGDIKMINLDHKNRQPQVLIEQAYLYERNLDIKDGSDIQESNDSAIK